MFVRWGEGEEGGGADSAGKRKGPPSSKSVSLIAQVTSCNDALLPWARDSNTAAGRKQRDV